MGRIEASSNVDPKPLIQLACHLFRALKDKDTYTTANGIVVNRLIEPDGSQSIVIREDGVSLFRVDLNPEDSKSWIRTHSLIGTSQEKADDVLISASEILMVLGVRPLQI